ncbi:disulfide bond formation protein B [Chelatococcus sp. SYSU_G07232]|uniref:Disulfide bond formation protein B n=1 Tax=Chelatococcus albus TaxID=3047466 RepID=A0ABT7AJJ6_9HYPH|nr:disulfide bond formation protein B [Chelatococcus sp. SYSU_G07232]MDJ1159555.1 disulfide bond formation protein B [Chelatococcus sp. SYSU_G07232]
MQAVARFLAVPRRVALAVFAAAAATIAGAYFFEYVLRLPPCDLCLMQRVPYYAAMPLAVLLALLPARPPALRVAGYGLGLVAAIFLVGAALAGYHAGVEWALWQGPGGCTGAIAAPAGMGDFLKSLETVRVVRCDQAAWRFLGLSLAGWNVLISLAIAAVAGLGARAALTRG